MHDKDHTPDAASPRSAQHAAQGQSHAHSPADPACSSAPSAARGTEPVGRRPLVVATRNRGKAAEIGEMLADTRIRVHTLREYFPADIDIPETGDTFVDNARIKAQWVAARCECLALADDSGLEVDALDGAPGVYSARFAGPQADDAQNNDKLLRLLQDTPRERRTARFRCCMVLIYGENREFVAEGTIEGHIGSAPAGTNGFGYDPLFIPRGYRCSFAQLDARSKNAMSHRGQALRTLHRYLQQQGLV